MTGRGGSLSEAGFTLVEMLVALAVFAIAALALLRLNGYAIGTAADLDARSMASLVARNEAALAATDPGPIVRGSATTNVTNGGRSFVVRKTVTPTDDRRLVRVDIVVVQRGIGGSAAMTVVKRVG